MNGFETRVIEFDISKRSFQSLSIDDFEISSDENKIYWIHCDLNQENKLQQLSAKLHLPDDVIELCNQKETIPKLIDSDETLTIQIQCLLSTEISDNKEIEFSNLIIHLTQRFCFTAAWEPLPVLNEFIIGAQKAVRYAQTPCFILFLLFDNAINDYSRTLFNYELVADEIDLEVRTIHKNIYNEVMDVKQQVMRIKRYVIASREILLRISGRHISVISEQCRTSLYNLSNHSHMLVHEVDSIRDMLNGLLDQIDNTLMQKLNETMKVLTAFAAIFLPLTLITGIYGMNFAWIPELHWKYGYFWALFLIAFFGGVLLFIFKKNKWF